MIPSGHRFVKAVDNEIAGFYMRQVLPKSEDKNKQPSETEEEEKEETKDAFGQKPAIRQLKSKEQILESEEEE